LNKSWSCWCNKFYIKLVMIFFMYVLIHVCLSFNFDILKESNILWYPPRKYCWYSGAWIHYNWMNIWFKHLTQYSSEQKICEELYTHHNNDSK
jgi:hypothetical protein